MPSDIQGILLVPAEGDPYGLLADGPCGARPPMAGKHDGYWYEYESDGALGLVVEQPDGHWDSPEPDARALALAWAGEPVAEGTYWLYCRMGFDAELEESLISVADLLSGRPADVYWLRRIGTLVLIDAEGREVTDAE